MRAILLTAIAAVILSPPALCERAGAIPTTTETIVFDWLGRAGTDAFRAISKLVR